MMPMNTIKLLPLCKVACDGLMGLGLCQTVAFGEWQRDDKSLAWVSGTNGFWRVDWISSKKGASS
jgi:hypothetical protein